MNSKTFGRASVAALAAVLCALPPLACAQSFEQLKNDAKSTSDVLTYGMGYSQQRYSRLKQINKGNVRNLAPMWNLSLDNSTNASTQPLVVNGVIYVASHNATTAIDGVTGRQKWKTPIELPADVNTFLCCGIHTRGLAVYDGMIYRTTIDAHVMAINMTERKRLRSSSNFSLASPAAPSRACLSRPGPAPHMAVRTSWRGYSRQPLPLPSTKTVSIKPHSELKWSPGGGGRIPL